MRAPALAALLLAASLSGCLSTSTSPLPGLPAASMQPALDCAMGAAERALDAGWAQDCSTRASHSPGPKEEIWLAVNPKDEDNVVIGAKDLNPASSNHCVWNGVSVTHDGGRHWKDVVIGGTYASRDPASPFFGYACNTDPDLQFTSNGDVHYGVELYGLLSPGATGFASLVPGADRNDSAYTPGWKILLATSHDGGDTWPDVVTFMPDTGPVVDDYSRMTVVPTTQTILEAINLGAVAENTCNVLSSRDGGKSADPPVEVAFQDTPTVSGCGSIAGSPKGTVTLAGFGATPQQVAGTDASSAPIYVARSTDDGRTFLDQNPAFTIRGIPSPFNESQYRTGTNFEMAYDLAPGPGQGTLYAIYADSTRDEADIFVRASKDDGRTWGEPVRVNDDAPGAHQFEPNVVVARDHTVHAFFMDKRYDPAHKLIGITHAWSADGGATWRNERVTNMSFDGDLGVHQRGFPFIGDYIGIGTSGGSVWGAWPDASNGSTTVVSAARVRLAQP